MIQQKPHNDLATLFNMFEMASEMRHNGNLTLKRSSKYWRIAGSVEQIDHAIGYESLEDALCHFILSEWQNGNRITD